MKQFIDQFLFIIISLTCLSVTCLSVSGNNVSGQKEITKKPVALITGITGQDGSYLAEFLLQKNYEVHGLVRRSSSPNYAKIEKVLSNPNLHLHIGDLTDYISVSTIINKIKPDEIYNLAAQSHVMVSFKAPLYTAYSDALGVLNILEAIRGSNLETKPKFYQASTSEMFGKVQEIPQSEKTPFYPRSPYGVAKLYAHWITVNYRESYDIFACSGILFNHESERRGEHFVTRKITKAIAQINKGKLEKISLGNLDAKRDWGHAKDYVEAMWLILQQDKPEDYVIATGETHSVREFLELAFKEIGINIEWHGKGVNEVGKNKQNGKILIDINPKYFRPAEVELLIGDPAKAHDKLKWQPKINFKQLVKLMVKHDLEELEKN